MYFILIGINFLTNKFLSQLVRPVYGCGRKNYNPKPATRKFG
jgi:hypothetical protein